MSVALYLINAIFVAAVIIAFAAWFYAVYHRLAAMRIYWRSMPTRSRGLREMLWPNVKDAAQSIPYPPDYILHRNKSRRGVAAFFACWLVGVAVGLFGALLGQYRPPTHEQQSASPQSTTAEHN
jgi:hypothetical protein